MVNEFKRTKTLHVPATVDETLREIRPLLDYLLAGSDQYLQEFLRESPPGFLTEALALLRKHATGLAVEEALQRTQGASPTPFGRAKDVKIPKDFTKENTVNLKPIVIPVQDRTWVATTL